MKRATDRFYTEDCNDTTIFAYFSEREGWEIYYRKADYPFLYAFGLSPVYNTADVMDIARKNVDEYTDMFE